MTRSRRAALGAACASLMVGQVASIGPAAAQAAASAGAGASSQGSTSPAILCDGRPGHVGAAGTIGQLLVITATAGMGGLAFAKPDVNKRLSGREGVGACEAAIKAEGNEERRAEFALARTVHYLEAKDDEAALASARGVSAVAPGLATDPAFRHGAGASGQFLEAYTLVRLGRAPEAEAVAIRMARALPYDLLTAIRAAMFLRLTPDLDAGKAEVMAQAIRLDPSYLGSRAQARDWVGDYAGAADDLAALRAVLHGFNPDAHVQALEAGEAVNRLMAGQTERGHALTAEVRAATDTLVASGDAERARTEVEAADELLAFAQIADAVASGQMAQARTLFGAHTHWIAVPGPIVIEMATRLRRGAAPVELTGALADDPATTRANALKAMANGVIGAGDQAGGLYRWIMTERDGDYSGLTPLVWRVGDRPPFLLRNASPRFDTMAVVRPNISAGPACGEALILQAALIARARGQASFTLSPGRKDIRVAGVLFGGTGDGALPPQSALGVNEVIAALGPAFPKPPS